MMIFIKSPILSILLNPQNLPVQSKIGLESGKGRYILLANSGPVSERQVNDYTAIFAIRSGQGI